MHNKPGSFQHSSSSLQSHSRLSLWYFRCLQHLRYLYISAGVYIRLPYGHFRSGRSHLLPSCCFRLLHILCLSFHPDTLHKHLCLPAHSLLSSHRLHTVSVPGLWLSGSDLLSYYNRSLSHSVSWTSRWTHSPLSSLLPHKHWKSSSPLCLPYCQSSVPGFRLHYSKLLCRSFPVFPIPHRVSRLFHIYCYLFP